MTRPRCSILPLLALLSACGAADPEAGAGGIAAEDARALDRAAEKLDARQADPPLFPEDEDNAEPGDQR